MLGILDAYGFKYAVPEGAYFVMADFRQLGAVTMTWPSGIG